MEYLPEFMALKRNSVRRNATDVTRETFLAKQYRPERLLESIRGVHFLMPVSERDDFAMALTAFGWTVVRVGEDAVASNAGVELRVTGDAARRGLVELRFGLRRALGREEIVMGHSRLVVGPDASAIWRFDPTTPIKP